jgi:hypothetical protein
MSFQINLRVQISTNDGQANKLAAVQEAALTSAVRRAIFDALQEQKLAQDAVVTIRGPEVVLLF